jgi:alpha-D-ribose 1-methylphosphonate 5-triphosphate synthase subunit PhnG
MEPDLLADRYQALVPVAPSAAVVRGPETGMLMVRGRIGGGGAPFNLGEVSVTRATVKLATGQIGHSVIMGRELARASMVAHLDALRQLPDWRARVDLEFVEPALAAQAKKIRKSSEETEATRVDFFTLVRGED